MAFLITWTTHNSWLPGDPRGFRTYKHRQNIPPPERYAGSEPEFYKPEQYEKLYLFHSGKDVVMLTEEQRRIVAAIVTDTIQELCPDRWAFCVGELHVHVLLELGGRVTAARFCHLAKGRSARKLIVLGHSGKVWARRYHSRHIESPAWDTAKRYVLKHKTGKEIVRENPG